MHSKLPWKYVIAGIGDWGDKIVDADGEIVVCQGSGMDDQFFSDEDAAFLIQAVNTAYFVDLDSTHRAGNNSETNAEHVRP